MQTEAGTGWDEEDEDEEEEEEDEVWEWGWAQDSTNVAPKRNAARNIHPHPALALPAP